MDTSSLPLIAAATLLPTAYFIYNLKDVGKRESYLPPGPPTVPLLGNLNVFPKEFAHYKFTEWARTYGEIYSLKMGPATAIVISSAPIVKEMMEKRSATTSDRPPSHMVDIITGGRNLVLARYSDDWRALRRGAHEILTPQACMQHLPIQQAEATQLMYDLIHNPEGWYTSVRRYSSSVIMSVLFGRRSPRFDTPETKAFFHVQHLWEHALEPGAHPPIDLLPILQSIPAPFAKWKQLAAEVRTLQRQLYFGLLDEVQARIKRGEQNGCWMETILERAEEWGLDRELQGYLGGVLIEGGSDTTSSFIQSLVLALVAYPEVQKKAKEEIDRVVGTERTPTLEDIENLPYCRSIILEMYDVQPTDLVLPKADLWFTGRPVAPLAIPHSTTADETYKGYFLPKGTTIFVNNWGMFHDPEVYPNPSKFDPERFFESETSADPNDRERARGYNLAFGSGRRICPGIHLANNSLRINVVNLLWGFDFKPALDPVTGKEVEPDVWDYAKGILTCPNPFKCRITPRSAKHAELIEKDAREAVRVFEPFEHELCEEDRQFVKEQRKNWA